MHPGDVQPARLCARPGDGVSGAGVRAAHVLAAPLRRDVQSDGRVRYWGRIVVAGEERPRFLRVVTLQDGETVHNAFFDRNFRESEP